ncbi:MAG: glycosyltransferase family 52 [Lachnospiraceae bacterium]
MKKRVYICHTFYHVYIAVIKELNLPVSERKKATLLLSSMSNDFGNLIIRAKKSNLFEAVYEYHEKAEEEFEELKKYRVDRGNIIINMFARIIFTKKFGKLQEKFIPVDLRKFEDIYVFCDSDPIGYYLNYKKIYYHALEDGLNCIKQYDTARYDNRGAFRLKALMSNLNLIFIQNGYGKYCLDMEVNNISCLQYPCKKYIEKSRAELIANVKKEEYEVLVSIFIENLNAIKESIHGYAKAQGKILVLTEPLCDLKTREQLFRDIVKEYGSGKIVVMKPHPRDVLNYKLLFPECLVLEGGFPMEILNYIEDLSFENVVSVFTVPDAIKFAERITFLGADFMDNYEDPDIHRQNEKI